MNTSHSTPDGTPGVVSIKSAHSFDDTLERLRATFQAHGLKLFATIDHGAEATAVGLALRSSFATALNELLYITAGLALVGAVCAMLLIRRKDFHRPDGAAAAPTGRAPAEEPV